MIFSSLFSSDAEEEEANEEVTNPSETDVLALGLASSTLLSHSLQYISSLSRSRSSSIAAWAGAEIACTGTYLKILPSSFTDTGLAPKNLKFPSTEVVTGGSRRLIRGMCEARKWNWAALRNYDCDADVPFHQSWMEAFENLTRSFATWRETASLWDEDMKEEIRESLWNVTTTTHSEYGESEDEDGKGWVLRNLSKRESVKLLPPKTGMDKSINRPCVLDHEEAELSLDDALLMRICWSSDYSYRGDQFPWGGNGVWAGDRFEVVYCATNEDDRWFDVTETVAREARGVRSKILARRKDIGER